MRITTPRDVKKLGTILGVWAHPDDESFLAGGLLAAAVENGQTVACVTATKGEEGSHDAQRWPPEKIAAARVKELEDSLKILGIKQHHWLGYRDGWCKEEDAKKACTQLLELAVRCQPDTILTFGPDGWTGHTDHTAVSAWVDELVKHLPKRPAVFHAVVEKQNYHDYLQPADKVLNIFYNIDEPPVFVAKDCDIYFVVPKLLMEKKCAALKAQTSQTESLFANFDDAFINNAFGLEVFVSAD